LGPTIEAVSDGFRVVSVAGGIPVILLEAKVATAIESCCNSTLGKIYLIEESTDLSVQAPKEGSLVGTGGEIARLYSTRNAPERFLRVSEEIP